MPDKKFCPFHAVVAPGLDGKARIVHPPCDPEHCALGIPEENRCAIKDIAAVINTLSVILVTAQDTIVSARKGAPDEQQHP